MDPGERRAMGSPKMEQEILDYVRQHPEGTWAERIARDLNHSRATITRYVGQLEVAGKLRIESEGQMKRIYPKNGRSTRNGGAGASG